MTATIVSWPDVLCPGATEINPVAFARSGGKSLGGIERTIRSDRGYWAITYRDVLLRNRDQRQMWNAVRATLGGRPGLVVVPVRSDDSAPYVDGVFIRSTVPHDDGSTFDDGTEYYAEPGLDIRMDSVALVGATIVNIRADLGGDNLSGIRFSYLNALYETGLPIAVTGGVWQVPVFPAIRFEIPANGKLEVDNPTCLMHLASDREMDQLLSSPSVDRANVNFVEAVDYWSDLAAGG